MLSQEEIQQKLRVALEKKFPLPEGQYAEGPWLKATFEDAAIFEREGKLWRIPYTVSAEQDVELGEPELVETQYETVVESLPVGRSLERTGARWEVRVLKLGPSANGFLWTRESAEALLPHLSSAPVGCYTFAGGVQAHADGTAITTARGPVTRNIVGDLQAPRITEDGVYADLHVHEDAGWLRSKLLDLERRGVVDKVLGLSVDTIAGWVPVRVREGFAKWIKSIQRLISVDVVTAPSADGRFIRATAGPLLTKEEDEVMKKDELIALIRAHRPQLLEGRVVEQLTDQEMTALVREALQPAAAPMEEPEWARKLKEDLAVRDTQARVLEALAGSKLPAPVKEKIGKRYAGRVAEAAEIEAAIKEEQEVLARLSESGEVRGFGRERAEVLMEPEDKIQVGLDRLFGVTPAAMERAAEAYTSETAARVKEAMEPILKAHKAGGAELRFRGFRDAYIQITGDRELSFQWDERARRVSEAIISSTWANVLGNTLYRRMLADYAEQDYGERNIITVGRAEDFRTKEATRVQYFGDLSTADPETADYTEITAPTDEKVSYAVIQKGNVLTITRKTIINDDLRTVSMMVGRLGRAARRTFARYVWNFWINNSAYDVDGVAWFHANHANLQSVAFANAEVVAAILKLQNMTEPGSGEKLGLNFSRGFENMGLWLAVPTALWDTARQQNEREYLDANFTPNAARFAFGRNSERIIVNPLFTDANDWGVFRDPRDVESLVMDFLMGREEPELFLADQPTVGQMFIGDKLQYKIRHEYGGDIADYRGAVKAVVA